MLRLTIIIALLVQATFVFSQTPEAIKQSTQKEPVYYKKKLVPKGEEYVSTAPEQISLSITINKPVSEVWKVIDNTPKFIEWFPGLKSGSFVDENETGLGAKRLAHLNSFKYYEEIVTYRPNEAWGFTMIESNSGAVKSYVEVLYLESIDDNTTKVIYKGGYEFNGIYRMMNGMMKRQISKVWEDALEGLKTYCEK